MSWPTRHGDLQARAWCPAPGPTHGRVVSRWVPPSPQRIECVVTGEDGRVAVAGERTVFVLAPDLRPLDEHPLDAPVRDVTAVPGGFLACAKNEIVPIGGSVLPAGLGAIVSRHSIFGARRLPDGTLLAWEGTDFARVDPGTRRELARYRTESTMSSSRQVAVGPDGTVWSAMGMSWSSEDDPTEYYTCVAAFAPDGRKLREWSIDHGLPSTTGFSLRVMAAEGIAVVFDTSVAVLSPARQAPIPFGVHLTRVAMRGADELVGVRGGHEIVRVPLPGGSTSSSIERAKRARSGSAPGGRRPTKRGSIARVGDDEWLHRVVLDGAGHVYAATDRAVLGFDAQGVLLFRIEPFAAESILLGEGFLLAVSRERSGGIIRIH